MDGLYNSETLKTLIGAAGATLYVTQCAKSVLGISGRAVNILSLVVAEAIAMVFTVSWAHPSCEVALTGFLNGVVIALQAWGGYKGMNLKKQ